MDKLGNNLIKYNKERTEKNFKERIGKKFLSKQGYEFEIIDCQKYNKCTIKFEDGVIIYNRDYGAIQKGEVKHPNCPKGLTKEEINAVKKTKFGWETKIYEWHDKENIDILFTYDGSISRNKSYQSFRNGTTMHPKYGQIEFKEFLNRMNETVLYPNGRISRIKEYRHTNDIDIIFDDGAIIKHTTYDNFHNAITMHPIEKKCLSDSHDRIALRIYNAYKKSAAKREYDFSLSIAKVKEIIFQPCVYCGSKGNNIYKKTKHLNILYNGIDRLNSNLGYIEGNVVPCCKNCNIGKNDLPYNVWIEYLNRMSNFYLSNRDNIVNRVEKEINITE